MTVNTQGRSRLFNFLRRFRLRTVLIFAILFVIVGGGVVSSLVVVWQIGDTIITQAQNRVDQDMNAAWVIYNHNLENIHTIVQMVSSNDIIIKSLEKGIPETPAHPNDIESWLQSVMSEYKLDIVTITDMNGVVVARAAPPFNRGDVRRSYPIIERALEGESISSTEIVIRADLETEAAGLARRAFMEIEPTPKAKIRLDKYETSGMVALSATPVKNARGEILGVVYAGRLLNRNYEIVDKVKDTVYRGEVYRGKEIGTTTIFQGDLRISTNVRKKNGQRAIGTRVSARVQDQVLENGKPWTGRAFVVNDWYITNYNPIRNIRGEIIGILYVGILEQKYLDIRNRVIGIFLAIIFVGSAVGVYYSYRISNTVGAPIRRLVTATEEIKSGNLAHRVRFTSFRELEKLAESFNDMSSRLDATIKEKDAANKETARLNQHYIEMLGFVTHELMHPLGILKGYLIMLLDGSLGPLQEKQAHTMSVMRRNVEMVINMTRTYLHLSKIERGELEVKKSKIKLFDDIVFPIIQDERKNLETRGMKLEIENGDRMKDVELNADPTLLHIVFNNLFQNALRYGKQGGGIKIGFREDKDFFRLNVRNEGDGVPPDQLEAVFEKFKRLEKHTAGGIRGTGLGLFNSRVIVERHGGKMWAESIEGQYADFIFTLPKN